MPNNLTRPIWSCRIHQIQAIPNDFIFHPYRYVQQQGLTAPPAELYRCVFDGKLETDNLEEIHEIFNTDPPDDYPGRSLSISDIVELYCDYERRFYYCDVTGFVEVPFEPADAE